MSTYTASILALSHADEIASNFLRKSFHGAPSYQFRSFLPRVCPAGSWPHNAVERHVSAIAGVQGLTYVAMTPDANLIAGVVFDGQRRHVVFIVEGDVVLYNRDPVPDSANWRLQEADAFIRRSFARTPGASASVDAGREQYHNDSVARSCDTLAERALNSLQTGYNTGLNYAQLLATKVSNGELSISQMMDALQHAQLPPADLSDTPREVEIEYRRAG